MKFKIIAFVFCIALLITGCQSASRKMGGNFTIKLPSGQKLVTASWKDNDIWYLTRVAKPGERPETLTYSESSNFGLLQGSVKFIEN